MDHLATILHACVPESERKRASLSSVSALTILKPSSSSRTYMYIIHIHACARTPLGPPNNRANGQFSRKSPSPIEDYRGLSCRVFSTRPAIISPLAVEKNSVDRMSVKTIRPPVSFSFFLCRWQKGSKQTGVALLVLSLSLFLWVEWVWTNKRDPMERKRGSTL